MAKHLSEYSYLTVYAYNVPDGGARAHRPVTIGKFMLPNVDWGFSGPRVYSRKEPGYSALFHKSGEFSIDVRAEQRWDVDNVEIIQFIDKESGHSFLIMRAHWRAARREAEHGAGLQAYVRWDCFEEYDHVVYDDSHYSEETVDLPPLPRKPWRNIEITPPKPPKGARPGQVGLL